MKFAKTVAALTILFAALAANAANDSFVADPKIQQIAEAYAQDAVEFSDKQFGVVLDWSDESVKNVEAILDKLSVSYSTVDPKPTPAQVMMFAKAYGSYIGEVYRRNHGATWGTFKDGDQKFPGLRTQAGSSFWPWGRAQKRITEGAENNVSDYYAVLVRLGGPCTHSKCL